MNAQIKPVAKATRNRAILRSYNYQGLAGSVKDANTQAALVAFKLSDFPEETVQKLALSAAMQMIAGAGVEAHNDGEDPQAAMAGVIGELATDAVEFRDGVGVAMGGTLKRVARALVDLGKVYLTAPDGTKLSWNAGDVVSAFGVMKELWSIPESAKGIEPKTESGRSRINRIKAIPEVAAKLAEYAKGKGPQVELG